MASDEVEVVVFTSTRVARELRVICSCRQKKRAARSRRDSSDIVLRCTTGGRCPLRTTVTMLGGTIELGCIMRPIEGEAVVRGWLCSYVTDEAVRPESIIFK